MTVLADFQSHASGNRQHLGLSGHWVCCLARAAMRRSTAVQPLTAFNDRLSLQATAGPDPNETFVGSDFQWQVTESNGRRAPLLTGNTSAEAVALTRRFGRQLRETKRSPDNQRNQHCGNTGGHCKVQYLCCASWKAIVTAKTAMLTFRIDPSLIIAAGQEHRSIANMVEILIRGYCERHGIALPYSEETKNNNGLIHDQDGQANLPV